MCATTERKKTVGCCGAYRSVLARSDCELYTYRTGRVLSRMPPSASCLVLPTPRRALWQSSAAAAPSLTTTNASPRRPTRRDWLWGHTGCDQLEVSWTWTVDHRHSGECSVVTQVVVPWVAQLVFVGTGQVLASSVGTHCTCSTRPRGSRSTSLCASK